MLSEQTSTSLYGKPLVKPSSIETELEKIRTAAAIQDAEKDKSQGAAPRARATLSNLIIVNTAPAGAGTDATVDRLINELCLSYPSRFFVVDGNLPPNSKASATGIATAVSSRCFLADSGAHVCSEEVYVSVEGKAVPLVPNLLVSLLAPDVDIVVLLLGDPAAEECSSVVKDLLAGLMPIADRVIYDSAAFADYTASLSCLAEYARKKNTDHPLGDRADVFLDVNWHRTKRWRSLIAEGFDAERLMECSSDIKRVNLDCHGSAESLRAGKIPGDALLLAGWILVSLSLEAKKSVLVGDALTALECQGEGPKVIIGFTAAKPSSSGNEGAGVVGVEILAENQRCTARLNLVHRAERGAAEVSVGVTDSSHGDTGACDFGVRNAPFLAQSFDELVLANIVSKRGDARYGRTLEQSIRIAGILRPKGQA